MTESSNQKDIKTQQPEHDATASSEPLQLDLFERWTGDGGWIKETPDESKPSRDFIFPPATDLATDGRPTNSRQGLSEAASAALSKDDASRSGGAK